MSTNLSTRVEQSSTHPPQHLAVSERPVRRVRWSHRVALHLGLALITWSRRPSTAAPSHEHLAQRDARERQAERQLRLTVPLR